MLCLDNKSYKLYLFVDLLIHIAWLGVYLSDLKYISVHLLSRHSIDTLQQVNDHFISTNCTNIRVNGYRGTKKESHDLSSKDFLIKEAIK
jgi:hypothetical protein